MSIFDALLYDDDRALVARQSSRGNISNPGKWKGGKHAFMLGEAKAIRFGKLSATRREDGSWSIDNAELAQYLDAEMEAQHRAELAEQRLADLQTMLDDMAAQRDAWQHQAQATQRFLADATARRPWWKRLTG